MKARDVMILVMCVLVISCKEEVLDHYDPSLVDRGKIDKAFHPQVSQVLFDHLYVVVDSTTYQALTSNRNWKQSYAFLDKGLPDFTPHQENGSTCYMRGHHHYIEILGPNNSYGEPVGKSGIGFSLENEKEHFHLGVVPKFTNDNDKYLTAAETVSMPLGVTEPTWFKTFYTPSPGTALHTWYAFYNPGFLDELHHQKHHSYTREAFLKDAYDDKKLFNGIHTIHLMCTAEDYQRVAQEMYYLGCELLDRHGKKLLIKSGDVNISLSLSENIEYSRITRLECNLNMEDNSVTRLGNLTITNSGRESVWELNQIHQK
ncbi:MAG: DUF5829 family protein [Bacteroidota bacterium]